jgi:hypothetical protein
MEDRDKVKGFIECNVGRDQRKGSRLCQKIASDPIDSSGEGRGYMKRGSSPSSKSTSAVPNATPIAIIILCPSPPLSSAKFP